MVLPGGLAGAGAALLMMSRPHCWRLHCHRLSITQQQLKWPTDWRVPRCSIPSNALFKHLGDERTCSLQLLVYAWQLPAVLHQPMPLVSIGLQHHMAARLTEPAGDQQEMKLDHPC